MLGAELVPKSMEWLVVRAVDDVAEPVNQA